MRHFKALTRVLFVSDMLLEDYNNILNENAFYAKEILMKIKSNFILRNVADTWVVLSMGDTSVDFDGMLTLNESGVILWNTMENGCDKAALVKALTDEYDVSADLALADVETFINKLSSIGCIEE